MANLITCCDCKPTKENAYRLKVGDTHLFLVHTKQHGEHWANIINATSYQRITLVPVDLNEFDPVELKLHLHDPLRLSDKV